MFEVCPGEQTFAQLRTGFRLLMFWSCGVWARGVGEQCGVWARGARCGGRAMWGVGEGCGCGRAVWGVGEGGG